MGLWEGAFFIGMRRRVLAEPSAPDKTLRCAKHPKGDEMILPVVAILKEICEKGREYLWPKPRVCPCCKAGRLWGHGFVSAYFDGVEEGVYVRRYRCPHCGCVIRLKPAGFFKRFRSSIETIRSSVRRRADKTRSPTVVSRTREAHWLKALKRKAKAYLGDSFGGDLAEAFDGLWGMGKIPVSRSMQC
jgi:hypothetical protein